MILIINGTAPVIYLSAPHTRPEPTMRRNLCTLLKVVNLSTRCRDSTRLSHHVMKIVTVHHATRFWLTFNCNLSYKKPEI